MYVFVCLLSIYRGRLDNELDVKTMKIKKKEKVKKMNPIHQTLMLEICR